MKFEKVIQSNRFFIQKFQKLNSSNQGCVLVREELLHIHFLTKQHNIQNIQCHYIKQINIPLVGKERNKNLCICGVRIVYTFFKQKSGKKKGSHRHAFKNGLNNILS